MGTCWSQWIRTTSYWFLHEPTHGRTKTTKRWQRGQNMPMPRGPPQRMMMQPPMQQQPMELNSTMLAQASEAEQNDLIGTKLYNVLLPAHNDKLARKLTGMFLEGMDVTEILHLLDNPEALGQKVQEGLLALEEHQQQQQEVKA